MVGAVIVIILLLGNTGRILCIHQIIVLRGVVLGWLVPDRTKGVGIHFWTISADNYWLRPDDLYAIHTVVAGDGEWGNGTRNGLDVVVDGGVGPGGADGVDAVGEEGVALVELAAASNFSCSYRGGAFCA